MSTVEGLASTLEDILSIASKGGVGEGDYTAHVLAWAHSHARVRKRALTRTQCSKSAKENNTTTSLNKLLKVVF